jgi:predicted porin
MKKSLFAIAAVTAFAGAAQAQSSVTVYGIMDAGAATVTNTTAAGGSTTGLQSGGLAASRLGFRGTEDLGGGLRAGFVMESEINTANGSATGLGSQSANGTSTYSSSQFFNRASYVSLTDAKVGEIRLGLSNTATYDYQVNFDPLKAANLGGYLNTSTTIASTTTGPAAANQTQGGSRGNNAVSYLSPRIMGAQFRFLTGEGQAAAGNNLTAGIVSYLRVTDFGLSYNWKALNTAISYRTVSGTTGAGNTTTMGAFGSYDFGVVKPYAIYNTSANNVPGATSTAQGYSVISKMVGLEAPITPTVSVAAQYTMNVNGNAQTSALSGQSSAIGALAKYSLSKRTSLYALGAWSQNSGAGASIASTSKFSGGTAPVVLSGGNGSYGDQAGYMLGINHTF